jgi:hypothetical protein
VDSHVRMPLALLGIRLRRCGMGVTLSNVKGPSPLFFRFRKGASNLAPKNTLLSGTARLLIRSDQPASLVIIVVVIVLIIVVIIVVIVVAIVVIILTAIIIVVIITVVILAIIVVTAAAAGIIHAAVV